MADRFEVSPEMRAFAEKSVDQAKQAVDGFMSAAVRAVGALEEHTETARQGAKDITEKAMSFAERNIASSFEFTQKLMRANDMQEVLALQAEYLKTQMQVFAEQAKQLGESTIQAAKNTTKTPSS